MAARNRIEMSQALFARLIASAEQAGMPIDAPEKGRWIKRRNKFDISLMSKADVQPLILGRHSRALMVSHEGARYYLLVGFRRSETEVDGFEQCDLTPGLFALAVLELDLAPTASAATIREVIEGRYAGVDEYYGHELDEVSPLFQDILCLSADSGFPFTDNFVRALGSYLSHTFEHGALEISEKTLQSLARLFETGNKHVPYNLILQGMLSFSWQSFYLEVYRCIENMYPLSRLKKLCSSWKPQDSLWNVAILLEKDLSWRPREEEALASVLRECSLPTVQALNSAMGGTPDNNDIHTSAAKLVYVTRNELVHFRPRAPSSIKPAQSWDEQVRALIDCLDEIYTVSGDTFHELQVSV